MPRTCTVCNHPNREEIDKALIGGAPYRHIASQYGTSTGALQRHKADDLPSTMVKAAEAEDVAHAIDVVRQLRDINTAAQAILVEARKEGNGELALKAVDRIQKQIELQAKLLGTLSDAPQVTLMLSPEWLSVRSTLVQALMPFPQARAALAGALLTIEAGNGRNSN